MTAAHLDVDRFQKVRKLVTEGATPGERTAARSRAEALAKAAGLSFANACRTADHMKGTQKVRTAPPPEPTRAEATASAFDAIFNTPEMRAERAVREIERQTRCRELLAEYGSEDVIWADTPNEIALRNACRPIIVKKAIIGGAIDTLAGWDGGNNMPEIVRSTVTVAIQMPDTVAAIWTEFAAWEAIADARSAFCPDWSEDVRVRARRYVLESKLDRQPATSLEDIRARFDWMAYTHDLGFSRDIRDDTDWLTTVRADVERLAENTLAKSFRQRRDGAPDLRSPDLGSAPVQDDQPDRVDNLATRSTSDRRRAVMSMLDTSETAVLPDREIARRVGVSPTTVGNLRRKSPRWRHTGARS